VKRWHVSCSGWRTSFVERIGQRSGFFLTAINAGIRIRAAEAKAAKRAI